MASESLHIMFAGAFDASAVDEARSKGRVTVLDSYDQDALVQSMGDVDALLVRTDARVTRRVLENAPRLRVIGRGGTGLDNIDLQAARERGISVVYTPAAATDAVADLTVGMMIALLRQVTLVDGLVRAGRFDEARAQNIGAELSTLTLGIVGMGRIGKAVGRRCRLGFGMTVLYNDIVEPGPLTFEATSASKEELFARCDVVSLHVPLTRETRGMISADALALFKHTAILINTARGAVVDDVALAGALRSAALGGAALDVFDPEPLPPDHPLLSAPHTVLTPHIGARTVGSLSRMNDVVHDVLAVLEGRAPRYPAR